MKSLREAPDPPEGRSWLGGSPYSPAALGDPAPCRPPSLLQQPQLRLHASYGAGGCCGGGEGCLFTI